MTSGATIKMLNKKEKWSLPRTLRQRGLASWMGSVRLFHPGRDSLKN
jgi:hypothetical protein